MGGGEGGGADGGLRIVPSNPALEVRPRRFGLTPAMILDRPWSGTGSDGDDERRHHDDDEAEHHREREVKDLVEELAHGSVLEAGDAVAGGNEAGDPGLGVDLVDVVSADVVSDGVGVIVLLEGCIRLVDAGLETDTQDQGDQGEDGRDC